MGDGRIRINGKQTASNNSSEEHDYSLYTPLTRWIALFAVMLGTVLEVLDVSVVNVAIPEMMGNLGATLDQIGWVSTGYIIANVIILPLTGWLSAMFGRRRYLAGSMILFTVASVFCGTSRSLNELVFFRILQGMGGAALLSTAQATLLEIFPPAQVGMVQGIFSLGVVVAPTVGPTLGGWITDRYSWPWVFFINLPIGIIATLLTLMFIKDSKYQHKTNRVDLLGIGLLAIGLGCLQTVLERGNREGWLESSMIGWLALASVLSLLAFFAWELYTPNPAVNLRLFRYRTFVAGCAIGFILGFGLYGGVFILPIFLQSLRHFNAEQTGLLLFPGGVATGITALVIGRSVNKIEPRAIIFCGSVLMIISMVMLHSITVETGAINMYWPLIVRGLGLGCIFVPLTLVTLTGLKGRDVSYGTGLFNLMRQLGGSVGIAYLSTVIDHRTAFHRAGLVEHITAFNPAAILRIDHLQQMFMSKGMPLDVARQQGMKMLDDLVQTQAAVMAFEDAFLAIAIGFAVALPLIFLFKRATRPVGHFTPD